MIYKKINDLFDDFIYDPEKTQLGPSFGMTIDEVDIMGKKFDEVGQFLMDRDGRIDTVHMMKELLPKLTSKEIALCVGIAIQQQKKHQASTEVTREITINPNEKGYLDKDN